MHLSLSPSRADVLTIDVHFDLICPWCLIGKRQLAAALAELGREAPGVTVRLRWHPVQLVPEVPAGGWPFAEFYERRLGSPGAVRLRQQQVLDAARQAGADIDLSRIRVFPNTTLAHQLLATVAAGAEAERYEALLERLFAAYFVHGEDIGDAATLTAIAAETGLDEGVLVQWREQGAARLRSAVGHAVRGVPDFCVNNRIRLSGAQPPERLLAALRAALDAGVAA